MNAEGSQEAAAGPGEAMGLRRQGFRMTTSQSPLPRSRRRPSQSAMKERRRTLTTKRRRVNGKGRRRLNIRQWLHLRLQPPLFHLGRQRRHHAPAGLASKSFCVLGCAEERRARPRPRCTWRHPNTRCSSPFWQTLALSHRRTHGEGGREPRLGRDFHHMRSPQQPSSSREPC